MPYRIGEVAERANVPEGFVRQLIDLGALPGEEAGLGIAEVRRSRLLHSWAAAGLSVETILALVDRGALSLAFLDTPVMERPERLDRSYRQLAADRGVPVEFLQAVHQALGFAPPEPGDRAGEDDATMLDIAELFRGAGGGDDATLRLLAVYADSLRRIAKAEADYYETNIERRLRATGLDERQLIELGSRLGDQILTLLERALLMTYRRHREHIWTEHADQPRGGGPGGVPAWSERVPKPPAICFVDLTGYTQLTEERGDAVAAAGRRAAGRPRDRHLPPPRAAGPSAGWATAGCSTSGSPGWPCSRGSTSSRVPLLPACPPAHVGIHTGPVIAQDGDVYGRTVNLAARIASYAQAGQVVVSEDTAHRSDHDDTLRFQPLGPVDAQGRRQTPGALPGVQQQS